MLRSTRPLVVAPLALGLTLSLSAAPTASAASSPSGEASVVAESMKKAPTLRKNARIVRVVDGDTLLVRYGNGARARVRILGIDTPEVYGNAECWGARASKATRTLLPVGRKVRLVSDSTQDREDQYGRQLRYVLRSSDGLDVGQRLLRNGHATTFIWGTNPLKKAASYRKVEGQAKKARRGLWRAC